MSSRDEAVKVGADAVLHWFGDDAPGDTLTLRDGLDGLVPALVDALHEAGLIVWADELVADHVDDWGHSLYRKREAS